MILRSEVEEVARSFCGTPFKYKGRVPGLGLDCSGVIAKLAEQLGFFTDDYTNYSEQYEVKAGVLVEQMSRVMDEVPIESRLIGDVAVFWVDRRTEAPLHLGVLTDRGMVHVHSKKGSRVAETGLGHWKGRMTHVFRFRGIA